GGSTAKPPGRGGASALACPPAALRKKDRGRAAEGGSPAITGPVAATGGATGGDGGGLQAPEGPESDAPPEC
ncbi:hypothetical protein, partial [Myxococcus sp. AM011]|uniref:hypothetical protein n=1 Tax=Myxococcus sp. AM011 TaxID=2745200 RepID=UPI001C3E5451